MKIQSTPITFIDQTDSRKLEVYIKSNLPTTQIRNSNTGAFTPDWTKDGGLKLEADVFLDSRKLEESYSSIYSVKWYKEDIVVANNTNTINIKENMSNNTPIVTYVFEVTYQNITASSRITFTRVDTGLDGDGKAGRGIESIVEYYLATAVSSGVTTDTAGWTDTTQTIDAYKRYLWNYEVILYNDGTSDSTDPIIIGTYGRDGADGLPGNGIGSIEEWYLATSASSGVTVDTAGWKNTVQLMTSNNKYLWNYELIAYTNGDKVKTTPIIIGVYGDKGEPGNTGKGISSIEEQYYHSTSATAQAGGNWSKTAPTWADGKYIWTRSVITYTDATTHTTTPICVTGQKGGTGGTGTGVESVDIWYYQSTSATALSGGSWSTTAPTWSDGKYVWTKTITTYTDKTTDETNAVCLTGQRGATGVGIKSVTEKYLATASSSGVTISTTGWTDAIQTITATNKYLWNYEIITYTNDTTTTTTPVIIGVFGNTGSQGKGIKSITEYYLASASASGVTTSTTGWTPTIQTISTTNKYLWNYELITYTDNTTSTVAPVVIGVYGDKGDSGTPASLVDIVPSAMYFKSTTGSTGTFTPEYIYLYPRFQNATYSNWQYSRDGGATWTTASGANGLTIGTYNSVANSLRIARESTLYTDSITSISFKCNSTTSGVYDTASITKIYDIVDLQIGGRNWLTNSGYMTTLQDWKEYSSGHPVTNIAIEDNSVYGTVLTATGTIATSRLRVGKYIPFLEKSNRTLMFSMVYKADNISSVYVGGKYSTSNASGEYGSFQGSTTKTRDLGNGFTYMESKITLSPNADTRSFFIYIYTGIQTIKIVHCKLEEGDTVTDWSPAPEDLIEEAANVNVMLSNEAHFFEATAGGVPIDTSVTLDVVGYKGSVKSATTVGTISGIPSAGMTATVTNNGTTNAKLTIAVTSALTSDIADYGILTIPITVNGHTINKIFNWTKAKAGDVGRPGDDAVTFQVYSNNGYALSTSVPTITLQTFAYVGDVEIKAGATYQWYRHNNTDWVAVSGATNDYFNVSRDDVTFSNNYQCKMQFGGAEYIGVVTIEDKNDENKVFASKPSNYFAGDLWIVGTDYVPANYTVGTMLRAEHTNTGYTESDWVPATKYDDEIKELKDTVDSYKQYFSVNSTNGLQIGNSSINNDILTIDTINASTVNANSASLESLDIVGRYSGSSMLQAPVINLGKFSIVIESNGSLSIVANT